MSAFDDEVAIMRAAGEIITAPGRRELPEIAKDMSKAGIEPDLAEPMVHLFRLLSQFRLYGSVCSKNKRKERCYHITCIQLTKPLNENGDRGLILMMDQREKTEDMFAPRDETTAAPPGK